MSQPKTPASPEAIARYYSEALERHGDTAQGAGWPNEADRLTRFDVMAGIAGPGITDASVCDMACGTGALLTHLQATGRAPAHYLGVDIDPAAIAEARAKHAGNPAATFLERDILAAPAPALPEPVDYILVNGLFTVRAGVSEEAMWSFMETCLSTLWPFARRGLAFNVMSAVVDWTREDLFHVPMDALCRTLFPLAGRRVVLRNDYDLYEYTAYMHRDPVQSRGA